MSDEFNKIEKQEYSDARVIQNGTADNSQTAGEKQPGNGVTYSWVSPNIHQREDSGRNAGPNSWNPHMQQNQRYQYSTCNAGTEPGPGKTGHRGKKTRMKKSRTPMGTGKKWMMNVAMALVFGLIAGTVFYGVNAAGKAMNGSAQTAENTVAPITIASTDTAGDIETTPASSSAGTGTVASVAENAMPSLVTISTMTVEEMRDFFGSTQSYQVSGAGTGVIVGQNDTELLIATNNHVVDGATSLSVGFIDETSVEALVKGTDSENDLAVVAVQLADIPEETMNQIKIAVLGNSDNLALGEQVVAIGNALGYGQSVTSGYVSAVNRDLTLADSNGNQFVSAGLIQTDAAINSGNSGGALLNMKGELIGINEAKSSISSSGTVVDGVGFAIPISKAEPILENLMALQTRVKVDESQASYMGVGCKDVTSEISQMYNMPVGVCFMNIVEGGPADKAGAKVGDVLVELDGRSIGTYEDLKNVLQYYAAGEEIEIVVQRANEGEYQERTLTITLGSMSEANTQNQSGSSKKTENSNE